MKYQVYEQQYNKETMIRLWHVNKEPTRVNRNILQLQQICMATSPKQENDIWINNISTYPFTFSKHHLHETAYKFENKCLLYIISNAEILFINAGRVSVPQITTLKS